MSLKEPILSVLRASADPMTGKEIAKAAGLGYKSTIDALDRLLNTEQVSRIGRKSAAKWSMPRATSPAQAAATALEAMWHRRHPSPLGGGGQNDPLPLRH